MEGARRSRRRGRAVRPLLAGILAVLVLVAARTPVSAHANYVGSDPADSSELGKSPAVVALDFDQRVAAPLTTVTLVSAYGRSYSASSVSVDPGRNTRLLVGLPPLGRDTYRLSFSTRDPNDLHLTRGSVVFAIGSAPTLASEAQSFGEVRPAEVALRWLGLLGISVAAGGLMMLLGLLRVAAVGATAGARLRRRLSLLGAGGAALALGAHALLLPAQAIEAGGFGAVLTQSDFGARWVLEMTILASLLGMLLLARHRLFSDGSLRRGLSLAGLGLALGSIFIEALGGHSGGGSPSWGGVALRGAHLVSVDLWVGGLVALVLVTITLRRLPANECRPGAMRSILTMFARLAAPVFAVILVTGLLLAGTEVATVTALLSTTYGAILIVKVVAVALLALLAVRHARMVVRPLKAVRATAWGHGLRLSLPAEAGMAVFILVLGAGLASTPPARGPQYESAPAVAPSLVSSRAADLVVRVSFRPNLPGRNLLAVDVLNTRRPAPGPVRDVRVEIRRPGEITHRLVVAVHSGEQQTWDGGEIDMRSAGELSLAVIIDRPGLPSTRALLPWTVNTSRPPPHPAVVSTLSIAPVTGVAAAGVGLAFVGGLLRRRRRVAERPAAQFGQGATPAVVGSPDPVPSTPRSHASGHLVGASPANRS